MSAPSPDASAASLRPAGLMPRLRAGLVDFLVLFAQYNVVVFLFSLASYVLVVGGLFVLERLGGGLALRQGVFFVARTLYRAGWVWSGLVGLVYFPYWWQRDGRTFGMRIFKLRVVAANGATPRVGVVRAVVRGLASLVSWGMLALGFLWILVDERRQGWHDKLAGTLVVHTE